MPTRPVVVAVMGLVGALGLAASRSVAGVVFCQQGKRVVVRVDACKKKEKLVTPPAGPAGSTGQMGQTGQTGSTGQMGQTGQTGPAGSAGVFDSGCPGPRANGVCLLAYSNAQATTFTAAALQCANLGGDLCTDSQAWPLTVASWQNVYLAPAYLNGPHWTASFADNDAGNWAGADGGTGDDHSANSSYGYACCGGTTPPDAHVPVTTINGVKVVAVHNAADTQFSGAVAYCGALNADICSDSQTLLLRDAGALGVASWTNSHADNDANQYNEINGGTNDDTHPSYLFGFACCPSLRSSNSSCPATPTLGVCATVVHNSADANFRAAAQACAAAGADLCSDSQTALLHSASALTVPSWTNSHSDNDGGNLTTAIGAVPDNPNLTTTYGYACCVK